MTIFLAIVGLAALGAAEALLNVIQKNRCRYRWEYRVVQIYEDRWDIQHRRPYRTLIPRKWLQTFSYDTEAKAIAALKRELAGNIKPVSLNNVVCGPTKSHDPLMDLIE